MSQLPGSFRPSELADADARLGDADLARAWSTAREVEAALPHDTILPTATFVDEVMAAVALEPAPRPAGFLAALRTRPGAAGLAASLREAAAVVVGRRGWPARTRALALAYVLVVLVIGVSLTGFAAYGAAGALGFLDTDRSPSPAVLPTSGPAPRPSLSPSPSTPAATGSPEVTGSPQATETIGPEGTDDDASPSPGATSGSFPEASDGDGGSSPSPSADDDSGAGPSDTPRPSDTPKPSETPH